MPDRSQRVHHAQGQGVVLGHDDIVKGFLVGKGHHGVHVGGADVLAVGIIADAAVAGQRTRSRAQPGFSFSALMMACSRPPPPTTRIFISVLLDSTTARDEKSPQASCFLRLMMEQPDAAERHRNAVLVAGVDDLLVPDGAAGLHNGRHAAAAGTLDVVAEGEEGIAAQATPVTVASQALLFLRVSGCGLLGEGLCPDVVADDILGVSPM